MVVRGKSGPYGLPVSGLMDSGDAVPYGEPITLPQKMKYRVGSNALPRPMRGPHLHSDIVSNIHADSCVLNAPVLDICTPRERVADDHDIVSSLVEFAPCLVSHRYISKHPS